VQPFFWAFAPEEDLLYGAIHRVGSDWGTIAYVQKHVANISGLTISPQTMERWMRLWSCVHLLDDLLDKQPMNRRQLARHYFDRLISGEQPKREEYPLWVSTDVLDVVELFNNSVIELGSTCRERIVRIATAIADYGPRKAASWWVWTYAWKVAREGRLTAELAEACMTETERTQSPQAYRRFSREFTAVAASSNVRDHAMDLWRDHDSGLTRVPAHELNYCILIGWFGIFTRSVYHPRYSRQLLEAMKQLIPVVQAAYMEKVASEA
jgi:hypothetical protein